MPEGTKLMMRFDRFTERAQDAFARSHEILQRYRHSQLDAEHLLLALIEQTGGAADLADRGVSPFSPARFA